MSDPTPESAKAAIEVNPFQSPAVVDEPTTQKLRDDGPLADELKGVRRGLQLVYRSIVIILCNTVMLVVASIFSSGIDPMNSGASIGYGILLLLFGAVYLVAQIMMFVGQIRCCSIPERAGAKNLALSAVVFQAIGFVLTLLVIVVGVVGLSQIQGNQADVIAFERTSQGMGCLNLLSGLCGIIGFFCFLVFLKKLAAFIKSPLREKLAGQVIGVFVSTIGLYLAMLVVAFVAAAAAQSSSGALGIVGLAGCGMVFVLVLAIVGVCLYTVLLRRLIGDLDPRNLTKQEIVFVADPITVIEKND